MAGFDFKHDYAEFAHHVMRKARYVMAKSQQEFLASVVETSRSRTFTVLEGTVLWRAQAGYVMRTEIDTDENDNVMAESQVPAPFSIARMFPKPDCAYEGRVNPKGIPSLYLSTDMNTAMAEVRPWIGSYVSVGEFVTLRDLVVVDCTLDKNRFLFLEELTLKGKEPKPPDPKALEDAIWGHINWAFSEPVTRADDVAEYAPTQVLAEAFRHAGYDGIKYGSKVGGGKSIAAFALDVAELVACHIYQVDSFTPMFKVAGSSYMTQGYKRHLSVMKAKEVALQKAKGSPSKKPRSRG